MKMEELVRELETQRRELEHVRQENERLREENGALRRQASIAQEQVALARELFAQLTARIERLEGQVAKDSHNSSKPPSSDGPKSAVHKTKSLRGTSGKYSGGQPGHPGHTLLMVKEPDSIVALVPSVCEQCQHGLETV